MPRASCQPPSMYPWNTSATNSTSSRAGIFPSSTPLKGAQNAAAAAMAEARIVCSGVTFLSFPNSFPPGESLVAGCVPEDVDGRQRDEHDGTFRQRGDESAQVFLHWLSVARRARSGVSYLPILRHAATSSRR